MDDIFKKEISKISDEDIWAIFAFIKKELRNRGLVRTNNIVGERGEFLAIKIYKNNPKLPNLQAAPEGTQNVDALSRKGERYTIKTISEPGRTTSVFYGCGNLGDSDKPEKKFEYAIIVIIDSDFKMAKMLELSWAVFLKYRKWHKTMRAWNLTITQELLKEANIIF
jgi:hypothetical protein